VFHLVFAATCDFMPNTKIQRSGRHLANLIRQNTSYSFEHPDAVLLELLGQRRTGSRPSPAVDPVCFERTV
jgi:hypothetical protein